MKNSEKQTKKVDKKNKTKRKQNDKKKERETNYEFCFSEFVNI